MTTSNQKPASFITIDQSELDSLRSNVLRSQITTYRYLARNLPVPDSLLNSCSYKLQLASLLQNHIQQEQSNPSQIILSQSSTTTNQYTTDKPIIFSAATTMYQSLTGSNEIRDGKASHHFQKHPINLNPLYIQQEQEKR